MDAGVLIAHLNREQGRYERSRDLLLEAQEERIELWAPMVIQVEVARWSRDVDPADEEARAKLDDYLDSDWLRAVEVDRRMAKLAREIVATTQVRTGVDALYVATAVLVEAPVVYTWDERVTMTTFRGVKGMEPQGSPQQRLDLGE